MADTDPPQLADWPQQSCCAAPIPAHEWNCPQVRRVLLSDMDDDPSARGREEDRYAAQFYGEPAAQPDRPTYDPLGGMRA